MQSKRMIKYILVGLAIFLIIDVISLIITVLFSINGNSDIFTNTTTGYKKSKVKSSISVIEVDLKTANFKIEIGDKLDVETNNKHIRTKQSGNTLKIVEKSYQLIKRSGEGQVILYVPENYIFDEVEIENGAGTIKVEELNTTKLYLDLGAGAVTFDKLNVTGEASIETGAGKTVISNSNINNLDLDMGVGKVELNTHLTGNNDIDAGVGALTINLSNNLDSYKIKVEKGIGSCKLNGDKMSDNTYYGTGSSLIDIDGGIGTININTLD